GPGRRSWRPDRPAATSSRAKPAPQVRSTRAGAGRVRSRARAGHSKIDRRPTSARAARHRRAGATAAARLGRATIPTAARFPQAARRAIPAAATRTIRSWGPHPQPARAGGEQREGERKRERPGIQLGTLAKAAPLVLRRLYALERVVDPLQRVAALGAEVAPAGLRGDELHRTRVPA